MTFALIVEIFFACGRSSGIMDGSDTEVPLIESPTKTMIVTPPPTPDSKRSCLSEMLSEKSEIHISR